MAIYTVNYTKKNGFMKEPRIKQKNLEGDTINDSRYLRPTTPKAIRNYVPHVHHKKGNYVINLGQADLDTLVKKIGLYDENDNVITTAPLKNPNAPFWKHPDLKIGLKGSGTTLNDDDPFDEFWLKCFEADPRFSFKGEKLPPSMMSNVQYSVTTVSDKMNAEDESADETYEAISLLTKNEDDHKKLVSILRSLGVNTKDPDPAMVRKTLMHKITTYKDVYVQGRSERNIEMFIRLAKGSTKDLAIKDLITQARGKKLIIKNNKGQYLYGDVRLGTNLDGVEKYLTTPDNKDILDELLRKTKE